MPRPDEGLIHAWLDGQLPPEETARIEALAATDPEWAAAVAEARGLVATSSRILSALDRVPAGVVPKSTVSRAMRLPWWTKIAAAVVVVAGGSVVVMQNAPDGRMSTRSTEQSSAAPTPGAPNTPDASKALAQAPVASVPAPAAAMPATTTRVPAAAPGAGAPSGAGARTRDTRELRREALATQPATPLAVPAPPVTATFAEERTVAQDAERVVAEVSAAQSLVAKAAPSAVSSVAQQAQQASAQGFAQAQNTAPAQRVVAGIAAAQKATAQQAILCYRLVPDSSRIGVAIIMRAVRAAGDTLHLVPVESNVPRRAWIVWRDGMTGVMTTSGDLRSTIRVVATPTACPAP